MKPKNKILIQDKYWKNLKLESYNQNPIEQDINNKASLLLKRIKDLSKINKIFFYPSSFDPHKNHKILFNAFNKLSSSSKKM